MISPALEQCFSMTNHVSEITSPLSNLGITGFFYMRIFPDNSFINITSRQEHANNYFHQLFSGNYQEPDLAEQLFALPGVSLSAHNLDNKVWQDAKNLGYGNAISIYDNHTHMQEITCFYSDENHHTINNFYINQLDFLKKFKTYFVEKARPLIKGLEQNRCSLPDFLIKTRPTEASLTLETLDTLEALEGLIQKHMGDAITPKHVMLAHQKTGELCYLPPQRTQCLMHAAQGKSAKAIASDMNLSVYTIDYYLRILRKELGCSSTKQLIATYSESLSAYFNATSHD